MPATLTNKSRALVTVELKSGEWIHLAPAETSRVIDDVELEHNDRVTKLIDGNLVALARQTSGAETGPSERKPERTPKR